MLRFDLTPDTHLRLLEPRDADELHALVAADRQHLTPWMPWAAGQQLEDTEAFIRLTRKQIADDDGFQTTIVRAGRIVGMVGFHGVDWEARATSIGYWLAADEQGRGTMTRAVRALVDHAFAGWKLNRVVIQAAPENDRSRAIPIRLGFTEEGTLRQAEKVGDRYLDSVVYAMLADDWKG
jgi:ribosomal-protein-serine acetyltransferase